MQEKIHALIDLTAADSEFVENSLQHLISPDGIGGLVQAATVLLPRHTSLQQQLATPENWSFVVSPSPLPYANGAIARAAYDRCHLLVLLGPVPASSEALGSLVEAFGWDPHFGVTVPRECDPATGEIRKLRQELGDSAIQSLPRRVLTEIPDYYLLPEMLVPSFVIRDVLICNLHQLDGTYESLNGALQHYLYRVRRMAFRTIVVNHAVVPASSDANNGATRVPASDTRKLQVAHPDAGRGKTEFTEHPLHMHESLVGRLFSPQKRLRNSLLLDLRGVPSYMNGTAEAVLALCDALKQINTDWTISFLAEPKSIEYHRLQERFSSWPILQPGNGQHFTVALRPSQPWYIRTIVELHSMALVNFFAILDTIAWDILFEAPYALGVFWDFMCEYADGLLYNSFYTRDHVARRFPAAQSRPEYVFHHSFNPRDYVTESGLGLTNAGEYIFVIGNTYDHKYVGPTIDLLKSAFPFQPIKVLGLKSSDKPGVEKLESGRIPDDEIDSIFASSKFIVFPSFYEGFGLPILKGLSYGRTVIARSSDLLLEIAGNYRGPGTLLTFSTPYELVDVIGRVIHGCEVPSVRLGAALDLDQDPKTWRDVARGLFTFIERQMSSPGNLAWTRRERAIRQLKAY